MEGPIGRQMRKRTTSADVAAAAGVSRTTVSFVLNQRTDVKIPATTRRRVLDAATRLGYEPNPWARQLAGGRSHAVALVLNQSLQQVASDATLAETLRGLSETASAGGLRVMVELRALDGPNASFRSLLGAQHVDGLVLSGPRSDDASLVELLRGGFPVVLQGSFPDDTVVSVDVDNVAGGRMAVEHLLSLGHRRIACITNAPLAYTASQDRLTGYRNAIAAAGIAFEQDLVEEADFDAPSGHQAMTRLLARTTFDAVFVASDVVAVGAIGALRQAGHRVPDDISIVGFDDIPLAAYLDPPLTTVHLPAYELGQATGRALLERLADEAIPHRTLLPTELIERASATRRDH